MSDDRSSDKLYKENFIVNNLFSNWKEYSFFQAVYLLEKSFATTHIGQLGPVYDEVLKIRPDASLTFPHTDISGVKYLSTKKKEKIELSTTFLGLYGTVSPLPVFYTEDIILSYEDEDPGRAFMDIFHHRTLSLLYRSWLKYRYYLQFKKGGTDNHSKRIFSLAGISEQSIADKTLVPPSRLLKYAGLLSRRPRSASAVQNIISDFFSGLSVKIEQCIGCWMNVAPEQLTRLGATNHTLGTKVFLGDKVYDRAGKFRIHLKPRSYSEYEEFLPGGSRYKVLKSLVDICLTDMLAFDIKLDINLYKQLSLTSSSPSTLGRLAILGEQPEKSASVLVE